jgi:hypothetical protein
VPDNHIACRLTLPPLTNPEIIDVAQVDIREQRRNDRALRRPLHRLDLSALFKHPGRQPFADQPEDPPVADPMLNKPYQLCVADRVEERPNIRVEDPIDPPLPQPVRERVQRIVLSTLCGQPPRARRATMATA